MPMPSLSLVLPTLNERENVERFVPLLLAEVREILEILVVDDDSSDGTPEAVERLGRSDPRVRLIRRRGAPCLTAAIQEGILSARGDAVGWMDADLVMAPSDLSRLVATVDAGADVAIGSRFAPGGRIKGQNADGTFGRLLALSNLRTTEDPWLGVFLSWALNAVLLPALVGAGVRDYTSGILVGRREVLQEIRLRGDHGEYFIELVAALLAERRVVVEVPYRVQPRQYGRSKTGNALGEYLVRGRRYIDAGVRARSTLRAGGRAGPGEGSAAFRASASAKPARR
ncbi:MAG TPA: glycosyltransferase [Polyangiaceae bacterium]|nr:glycosyltransferase [Polyangiaceae bacterium]